MLKAIGAGIAGGLVVLAGQQFLSRSAHVSIQQQTSAPLQTSVQQNTNLSLSFHEYDKNIPPTLSFLNNWRASFDDNFAPGMRAYLVDKQTGKEYSLACTTAGKNDALFEIPENIRTRNRWFEVYAVDRDGNASSKTSCYSLDGVVLLAQKK